MFIDGGINFNMVKKRTPAAQAFFFSLVILKFSRNEIIT